MSIRMQSGGFISSPSAQITPSTTGLQILRTNAGATAVEWANPTGSGVVSSEGTSWSASQNITLGTYADITGSSVTLTGLTAANTYDIEVVANGGSVSNNTAGAYTIVGLMIDGTIISEVAYCANGGAGADTAPLAISGHKLSFTGATSIVAKLQAKVTGGTGVINNNTLKQQIFIKAIQQ